MLYLLDSRYTSLKNPVAQAELNHLKRVTAASSATTLGFIRRGMITASLLLAVGVLAMSFYHILIYPDMGTAFVRRYTPTNAEISLTMWGIAVALFVHIVVIMKTLGMASNAVLREKLVGTWDNLLLTNINARRLVLGKWWAVLCMVWKDYALLAVLRVGATIAAGVFILGTNRNLANLGVAFTPSQSPLLDVLLAGVIVVSLTLVNGLFSAAAGVTGSFIGRMNTPGIATAQAIRLLTVLVPIIILILPIFYLLITVGTPLHVDEYGWYGLPSMWLQLSLVDNGTLLSAMLANPMDSATSILLPVALIALFVYLLLTLALLQLGEWIARRQGAST